MNQQDYKKINKLFELMEMNSLEKRLGMLSRSLYYLKKDILENFYTNMNNKIDIIKTEHYSFNNLDYTIKFFPNLNKNELKNAKNIVIFFEQEWLNYFQSKKININYNKFKNNIKNILKQLNNIENIDFYIKQELKNDNELKNELIKIIEEQPSFLKNYDYSDNIFFLEQINNIKNNIFQSIYLSIKNIQNEFQIQIDNKNLKNNDAISFLNFFNNDFLKEKVERELIYIGGKYKKIEIFKDKSFILYDNQNNILFSKTLDFDYNESIINDLMSSIIKNKLRKNKNYEIKFSNLFLEDNNFINAMETIDNLLKYQNLLKSKKFDLINSDFSKFEYVNDKIMSLKYENEIEKYAKSIISNKYLHLYNNETFDYFKILYDSKIEKNVIQNYIGKKLAGFKDSESFNDSLKRMCNIFSGFTFEKIINEAKEQNIEIFYTNEDENFLILKIKDFISSKNMGSPSWCISRSQNHFDDYVNNRNQYFIYNFEKKESDISSLIGLTLKDNNQIYAAHYKNDKSINHNSDFLQEIIKTIQKKEKSLNLFNHKNS